MSLNASWVHGNSVLLERSGAPSARSKSSINRVFSGESGDIIDLGRHASVACLRIGWGARFVVYDNGDENNRKSGQFWCHYAIPTPVIQNDNRAEIDKVMINFETSSPRTLNVQRVDVWDGNKKLAAINPNLLTTTEGDDESDGGINGATHNADLRPDLSRLLQFNFANKPVFFGIGVSILIAANRAKDDILEIRSVGADFQIR